VNPSLKGVKAASFMEGSVICKKLVKEVKKCNLLVLNEHRAEFKPVQQAPQFWDEPSLYFYNMALSRYERLPAAVSRRATRPIGTTRLGISWPAGKPAKTGIESDERRSIKT